MRDIDMVIVGRMPLYRAFVRRQVCPSDDASRTPTETGADFFITKTQKVLMDVRVRAWSLSLVIATWVSTLSNIDLDPTERLTSPLPQGTHVEPMYKFRVLGQGHGLLPMCESKALVRGMGARFGALETLVE
uniref:Uncharacterized protein n=1 Tax=Coccidioides posadasii RMSCC 3488 TaxID=454284 RepID=A0A0J6FJ29_COCPO|nr:hypothetical protein CPAG_05168 [Coccidioides posadasii RMSCC 3488]